MTKEQLINSKLLALSKSTFRTSFGLKENDIKYIKEKGLNTITEHAYDFIKERLAKKDIPNDGKQTPTKGHPVFRAQHATACCCRGCLYKWHHIPKNRDLTDNEVNYIVTLIMTWIVREVKKIDD